MMTPFIRAHAGKHGLNYRKRIMEAKPDIRDDKEAMKIMAIWVIKKQPFFGVTL